ncbi:MAG: hypothetical protein QM680_07130 [Luteolibacter sp.]
MSNPSPRARWIGWALGIFPLGLFLGGGIGLWLNFQNAKKREAIEHQRYAQEVSEPLMADDVKKIIEVIGERNVSSEASRQNLTRTASMIEGLLGPSNTGYNVTKHLGPSQWPLLSVSVTGKNPAAAPVWVVTSYDSRAGSPGAEANATGLAATLAAAQSLAREKTNGSLHFVFLPHANDPESPVIDTAAALKKLIDAGPKPAAILCVEAMGAGDSLWLSSRDTTAMPLDRFSGLGTAYGAEVVCLGDDVDLASTLFEMNLPAVRVATRALVSPEEIDQNLPDLKKLTSSTGRLIELIRRCLK